MIDVGLTVLTNGLGIDMALGYAYSYLARRWPSDDGFLRPQCDQYDHICLCASEN